MTFRTVRWPVFLLLLIFVEPIVLAQSGGPYVLAWSTIDGGGGVSNGGEFTVLGTIGQPDAAYSAGDSYELIGGFWPGGPICFVEFEDYARFAQYWLATGSDLPADLYKDEFDTVNWKDLDEFVYWWLYDCPYGWPLK